MSAPEPAGNDTTITETDDAGDDADSGASDDDEDDGQGSGSGQDLELGNWKLQRQFNSAMGMGIDAPIAQPQTNAYDVHNNIQQNAAPWESNSNGYVRL